MKMPSFYDRLKEAKVNKETGLLDAADAGADTNRHLYFNSSVQLQDKNKGGPPNKLHSYQEYLMMRKGNAHNEDNK